ncbi:2Fe-2S iron-sulfur cluster-binding protein [Afipia sp. GAS231]|uniref:2Fe-2S iron-sulfur cluster-binding protein n=1 Tax=Afipia sp. GAS231 TaxID=1882747 RepID=UPI00087BD433|nr:2Fe-2S iron-sulfur cluster-binding protein [Afipia sp. GAS231]SDP13073.1 CDP-4-dehydro-6-deoxyglucose reductase [Afipia sp. GAS231]
MDRMVYRVQVAETEQAFEVTPDETILAAALRANVDLPHDCQLGGCGTCRIRLVEGSVTYAEFPLALTPDEESRGYALACQAMPAGDLVIEPARGLTEMPPAARHHAVVRDVRPVSALVTHLALEVPAAAFLDYRPGQYMNVVLPDGTTRSFSMASIPRDNRVDFQIRQIEGGSFTQGMLQRMQPGDRLEVDLPLGVFHLRAEDDRPLLMVATGTGIAPIKAILESLMDHPDCPPVSLYWGGRTAADLFLLDDIRRWGSRLFEFNFVPVLSRADAAWEGRRGHVQHAVTADFDDLSEHAIYLCGSPAMIIDAKLAFIDRRASTEHIYSEGFSRQRARPVQA